LNYIIDSFGVGKTSPDDLNLLRVILGKTNLHTFRDSSQCFKLVQDNQTDLNKLALLRQDKGKPDDKLKRKKSGKKKVTKIFKGWELRGRRKAKRQMISMYFEVKNNEKVPVNPLELAIKKGLKDVIKIIISEFSVTPSMISSNFNETLFEIAAVKGVKVFQMVMESISAATQIYI